ncbi:hypothetical protein HYH03_008217 [Edaphochlamys debaryana]|uniref:Glycosyl transferase CAP10 domain-containing protein n=1 Tax=Edaphochlamys debaryana TaxID=47281 RepID=A0A835Y2Y3_9CHLO|nr:hypothetical protein HYH03_008217 [Edaphochlamys debaryana]|eukprot:KAG2493703.1 hypothetical protein HYH03_008217 [Edaphochlamys debaryana]
MGRGRTLLAVLALATVVGIPPASGRTLHLSDPEPEVLSVPLGQVIVDDGEWREFLEANLEQDLKHWRAKAPLRANDTWTLYHDFFREHPDWYAIWWMVLVWKNKLYWLRPGKVEAVGHAPRVAAPFIVAFSDKVSHWLERGHLQLPNVIFMPRWCGPHRRCVVPLFSGGKTIDHEGEDTDILIPQVHFGENVLHTLPWDQKHDLAFFRGIPFCSAYWGDPVPHCRTACPRTYLAWRSDLDARTHRTPAYLDVGLVEPPFLPWLNDTALFEDFKGCQPDPIPVVPRSPMSTHARYKYLVHLEGIAHSFRLSQLMLTNSLVLFQQQPFIEYFYRSLKPGVHLMQFWNVTPHHTKSERLDDIYDVIDDLRRRDKADPSDLQRIITASQSFAVKFLSNSGRARYLKDALTAYKSLFPDMDAYLEGFVAELRAKGEPLPR